MNINRIQLISLSIGLLLTWIQYSNGNPMKIISQVSDEEDDSTKTKDTAQWNTIDESNDESDEIETTFQYQNAEMDRSGGSEETFSKSDNGSLEFDENLDDSSIEEDVESAYSNHNNDNQEVMNERDNDYNRSQLDVEDE